ncbi:uncharacterized protein LOC143246825 isoform X2 [Tachypleus tridentatus]|uniref:uncharacterized protein LOC143246825 isoform X2 n=1 Tax=Tachypleus tridentatus TaxID=6853 RepID=UPI003FD27318
MEFTDENSGCRKTSPTNMVTIEQGFVFCNSSYEDSEKVYLPQQVQLNGEHVQLNQKIGNTEVTAVGNLPVILDTGAVKAEISNRTECGKENNGSYDMLPSESDVLKDGSACTLSVDVSHVLHSTSKQKVMIKVQEDVSGTVHDTLEEAKSKTIIEGFTCLETPKGIKDEDYSSVQGVENNKCISKGFQKEESSEKRDIPKPGATIDKISEFYVTCVNMYESGLDQVEYVGDCKQEDSEKSLTKLSEDKNMYSTSKSSSAKSFENEHWPIIIRIEREYSPLKENLPIEKNDISYQVLNILDKETVDVKVENCNQGRVVTEISDIQSSPDEKECHNEDIAVQTCKSNDIQVSSDEKECHKENIAVQKSKPNDIQVSSDEKECHKEDIAAQNSKSNDIQVSSDEKECHKEDIAVQKSKPNDIQVSSDEKECHKEDIAVQNSKSNDIQVSSNERECHKEDISVKTSKPNDIHVSSDEKECHKEDIIQVYCSKKQLNEQGSLVQFQDPCSNFHQSSLKANILPVPECGEMKNIKLQDYNYDFSVKHNPQSPKEMLKTLIANNRDNSIQVTVPCELKTSVQNSCSEWTSGLTNVQKSFSEWTNGSIGDFSQTNKEFFAKENDCIIPLIKNKSEQLTSMCKPPVFKNGAKYSDTYETVTDNTSQTTRKRKIEACSGTCGKQSKIVEATVLDKVKENKKMENMTSRASQERKTSNIIGLRTFCLRSSVRKIKNYSESHNSLVKSISKLYTNQNDKDEIAGDPSIISQMGTDVRLKVYKHKVNHTDIEGITGHRLKNRNTHEERRKHTPSLSVYRCTNKIQLNKTMSEMLEKQWAHITGRRLSCLKSRKKTKKIELTKSKVDDNENKAGGNKLGQNLTAPLEKKYDVRLRYQISPPHDSVTHCCSECGFSTSRLCNLIHHYKVCPVFFQKELRKDTIQKKMQIRFSVDGVVPQESPSRDLITASTERTSTKTHTSRKLFSQDKSEEKTVVNGEKYCEEYYKEQEGIKVNSYTEDDTEDDLPPAFDTPIKNALGFKKDDIVWVSIKKLYWPAVIRRIYIKLKKVSIHFIGLAQVSSGIRVSMKKIKTFESAEKNKKYLSLPQQPEDAIALAKAVQRAEDFLRKRCLGYKVDAQQFFETRDEDLPEYLSEVGNTRELGKESQSVLCPSCPTSLEEDCVCRETEGSPENQSNLRTKEKESLKLVNFIKTGQVQTHLLGVYSGTIPSDRHTKFHSVVPSVRNQIKQVSWFGPIDEEEEAIIKALSFEQGISLEEAETIFNHCSF